MLSTKSYQTKQKLGTALAQPVAAVSLENKKRPINRLFGPEKFDIGIENACFLETKVEIPK